MQVHSLRRARRTPDMPQHWQTLFKWVSVRMLLASLRHGVSWATSAGIDEFLSGWTSRRRSRA